MKAREQLDIALRALDAAIDEEADYHELRQRAVFALRAANEFIDYVDGFNLICPKCGAGDGEPCGWPSNCPVGVDQ